MLTVNYQESVSDSIDGGHVAIRYSHVGHIQMEVTIVEKLG